jgi:hypothetical protein
MIDKIKDAPTEFFDTNFWIGENNLSDILYNKQKACLFMPGF